MQHNFFWRRNFPFWPRLLYYWRLEITHRHTKLLWTGDRPTTEISTRQQSTLTIDGQPCPSAWFEPAIPAESRWRTH